MQTTKDRLLLFLSELRIGQKKFETQCGLSNGYVNKLKASPSVEVLRKIVGAFPQLNSDWLMTGEGEMLRPTQSVGDISNSNVAGVNVSGTDIHINPDMYNALLEIVRTNQKTTEKFQEQIDRLLALLEKKEN